MKSYDIAVIPGDGVGREVGFQSKSSFYGAFKNIVGMTPLAYQKQYEDLK